MIGRSREERFSAVARRVDSAPLRFRLVFAYDVPRGITQNTSIFFCLPKVSNMFFHFIVWNIRSCSLNMLWILYRCEQKIKIYRICNILWLFSVIVWILFDYIILWRILTKDMIKREIFWRDDINKQLNDQLWPLGIGLICFHDAFVLI